jgi:hypothetical protein
VTNSKDGAIRTWTVAEAKAQLSKILKLSETQGPQHIGVHKRFVVIPEAIWLEHQPPRRIPLGAWLVKNSPRGANLVPPDRRSRRNVPINDGDRPRAT